MRTKGLDELQELLSYRFNNPQLLDEAFTHSSVDAMAGHNYERLEFLGDAFINLVIADFFFGMYPDYPEGKLTRMKAHLVNRDTLAALSRELGLTEFVSIGKGMRSQEVPDSILCDIVEALCAAVFLDAGVRAAREFVLRLFENELEKAASMQKDAKSRLQEIVQKQSRDMPIYEIVDISGKEHERVFSATVTISGIVFGPCEGKTKKQSEQNAALIALKALMD